MTLKRNNSKIYVDNVMTPEQYRKMKEVKINKRNK